MSEIFLLVRLEMERLISEREMMKALNEWRASRGESQAYDDGAFWGNAEAFGKLAKRLEREAS